MKRHKNFCIILFLVLCISLCSCEKDESIGEQTQLSSDTLATIQTETEVETTETGITTTSETETITSQPLETGEKEVEDEQKITMTAKYNADTQMVEYTINNLSKYDFETGYSFDFEYLEDGKYIPVKKHEVCIPAIAEIYSPGEKINRVEYLPYWFNVKNGKYHLIKRGDFNKEKLNLYADFEVTGIENNNYIDISNVDKIEFVGSFNECDSLIIEDTTDTDIINKFVNKINTIEAIKCDKISGMGNWCEGLWDVIVHKDSEYSYNIHQENDRIIIVNNITKEKNNCLVIELSDDILKEFENTVFDFDNPKWNDGINYFERFISDVHTFDSYAGNNFDKHIVFVASEDLSEYKKIEQKYADEHNLDTVIYKTVEYSLNDLYNECEILKEKGKEFTVKSACANIDNNGITIYLEDFSQENQNSVRNLTDVKNIKFVNYTEPTGDLNPKT